MTKQRKEQIREDVKVLGDGKIIVKNTEETKDLRRMLGELTE